MKQDFDGYNDDELVEHLQGEYNAVISESLGSTTFSNDALMIQAALTKNQNAILERIATALEKLAPKPNRKVPMWVAGKRRELEVEG